MIHDVERILACPRCRSVMTRREEALLCTAAACAFRGEIRDGIVNASPAPAVTSFFDSRVPVMLHGADEPGSRALFYDQQSSVATERLQGAKTILDVGCGPKLMYARPPGSLIIGVDLSYESLRHNADVDVRVFSSATRMPIPDSSIDVVVCFYLLHHLLGDRPTANRAVVATALAEFVRVLRPGGKLLVFDVSPWLPAWLLQRLLWNVAKRVLKDRLDMFFWPTTTLIAVADVALPKGARLDYRTFRVPAFTMFPPAFSLQKFRVPRFVYPFDICMYQWHLPEKRERD